MKRSRNYVLVLDQSSEDLQVLGSILSCLRCPMVVAQSTDQAIEKANQATPSLIILSGNQQNWSKALVREFRNNTNTCGTTIVALTDFHAPSWLRQEENPGIDGFLVKPINPDILSSLLQSALVRHHYCASS